MSELANSLRSLLGAESSGEWVRFMDKIAVELPFLLKRGRPTAAAISDSEIGTAGCKSWSDYIEAKLNWNTSTWRAWQRAYTVVSEFPYLRELELSASAVNALKAKSDQFPPDLSAYNALRAEMEVNADKTRSNSLTALKQHVQSLEQDLNTLSNESAVYKASASKEITMLRSELSALKEKSLSEISAVKDESLKAKTKLTKALKGKDSDLSALRGRISRFNALSFIKRVFATP